MRISTASRYKFLKDYRIGVPELLSETSYSGNIIFNESDLRKSIGWLANTAVRQVGTTFTGLFFLDRQGDAVSINTEGDVVAVGASNGRTTDIGYTRIFRLTSYSGNGSWGQIGQTIDGEASGDFSGFSVSLNNIGDRVAIGARGNDNIGGVDSGHVRVYQLSTFGSNNSWVRLGQDIDGEAAADQFGSTIDLNGEGNILATGTPFNDSYGSSSGRVKIYQLSSFDVNNSWVQIGQNIDGESGDSAGTNVSLNNAGDRIAVSFPYRAVNGFNNSGIVKVFNLSAYSGNYTWVQVGQDITGIAEEYGYFGIGGISMNYSGDRIAIGSNQSGNGLVSVYELSGNNWLQVGQFITGQQTNESFGNEISINDAGDKIAVTSNLYVSDSGYQSCLRLYQLSSYNNLNTWVQEGLTLDSNTNNGEFNKIKMNGSGDTFIVGGPFATSRGNAKVFKTYSQKTDNLYTGFNDDLIQASRPRWKYPNNLNIYGGWYNNYTNSFLTDLQNITFSAPTSSNFFTEIPALTAINQAQGIKWVEIATKKNTSITLSSTPSSAIYFKRNGFNIRLKTTPQVSWIYNSNLYKDTALGFSLGVEYAPDIVVNNIFCNLAPLNTTFSAFSANYDNWFVNFSSEIQPISGVDRWLLNNTNYINSKTITLTANNQYIRYQPLGISYKNLSSLSASSEFNVYVNSNILDFGLKSTSSLRSRLTSVTPLTSTRNVFTTYNRTTNTFIRNPNLWCADLTDQLTALVVQKLGEAVFSYGGTLITPRHLLYVQHAFPRTDRVRFVRSDNTVISAAPLASSDSTTYKNDFPIASLSSVDSLYTDIGIVVLDRDVSLSGIHVMPIAAITPTEREILNQQFIPTLLCTQAPGRSTGSSNPNAVSASDIQMTISSTNFLNMTTAWESQSANPFLNWDVMGAGGSGYTIWDGDSGNSHLLFCNDKLYVYSITFSFTGRGAIVSALSGAINYLIDKADQLAGITTNMKPTYYTIEQIANR
jgi:hypothetical protein